MFPSQETISNITKLDSVNAINSSGKSPQFDFEAGDFIVKDGKVVKVKELDALKLWIKKVLKTEKDKYKIYDTNNVKKYGIGLIELITSDYPISYIEAQIQNDVTTVLLQNNDIKSVGNFIFKRDKKLLNLSFDVNTVYGNTSESVVI